MKTLKKILSFIAAIIAFFIEAISIIIISVGTILWFLSLIINNPLSFREAWKSFKEQKKI